MANHPLPIYLVHWNAPDWIKSGLATIRASDIPLRITVVDNGPPEALARLDLSKTAKVIVTGKNLGFAGGANTALRDWLAGEEPYCVIGAHDLHVSPTDLRLMVEAAEAAPSFGVLGPGTARGYDAGELLGVSEGLEERSTMSGTCLLLRRKCIEEIGLFDEQFRSYGEDNELCFRARTHGWKVGRVSGTNVHGIGSGSSKHERLRGRARVLLVLKTEGRAAAALRVVRAALQVAVFGPILWANQRHRYRAMRAWWEVRYGMPLLFVPMRQPPKR